MSFSRSVVVTGCGAAVALVALFGAAVLAQQADEQPAGESEDVEEIVVVAPKPGGRKRVDKEYEDPVRAKLLKDLHEMKVDQEEGNWRTTAAVESPSRIKWGYDPTDDYEMRNRLDMQDLPYETNKPATLFRVGF